MNHGKYNHVFLTVFLMLISFCYAANALAQVIAEPISIDDSVELLPVIVVAFQNGSYLAAGAMITMILIFLLKRFGLKYLNKVLPVQVKEAWIPLITLGLGAVIGPLLAIANGASVAEAILSVAAGPGAASMYSIGGKFFLPK